MRFGLGRKAVAEHSLKNVAGANVLLGFAHRGVILRRSNVRTDAELATFPSRFFARLFGGNGLFQKLTGVANLTDRGVVSGSQSSTVSSGIHVAHDPEPMLDVIEGDQAVIESEHGVVQPDFVAQPLGQAFDEPHHIVGEITDGASDERRKSGNANGLKALDAFAEEGNRVALFPDYAVGAFHDARTRVVAKNLLGMCTRKGVPRDFFAAFDAFEQKRVTRALRDAQIRADWCQQVGGKNVINRNQIALLGKALKFTEIRANHDELRPRSSARKAAKTARRMAFCGAGRFIHISHWANPCARNISTPLTVAMRFCAASFKSCVLSGR